MLKEFKSTLGWSIYDIRRINLSICMHKILMEDSYAPYLDRQRILNPTMKKIIRAEIHKLLNVGIIYPYMIAHGFCSAGCAQEMWDDGGEK